MSYQALAQYEAKAFNFEEFTKIFRNSFLLQALYAGYAASIAWTIHTLVFNSVTDSDTATATTGGLCILLIIGLAAMVTNSAWKNICERREVEFFVGLIKEKYDTTGMVFDDRFGLFGKVYGTRTATDGSVIDVMFIFDTANNNEPLYYGSFASVDFYPTPLFGRSY